jgi:hypothetical protein
VATLNKVSRLLSETEINGPLEPLTTKISLVNPETENLSLTIKV